MSDFPSAAIRYSLSDSDFNKLSSYIEQELGIKMPVQKKIMLESRLQKRLKALDVKNFSEYVEYLFSPDGFQKEKQLMINLVTTNKTDFFREPDHFKILSEYVLPDLLKKHGKNETYKFWSSACSSGEEPYTLAMVLNEYMEHSGLFHYQMLATDISMNVLEKAVKGQYRLNDVELLPEKIRKKYFLKSKDANANLAKVKSFLQKNIEFRHFNLLKDTLPEAKNHVVFCRNVLIYFNKDKQYQVLNLIHKSLVPGGYLFLGHSETMFSHDLPFIQVYPTVYKKKGY